MECTEGCYNCIDSLRQRCDPHLLCFKSSPIVLPRQCKCRCTTNKRDDSAKIMDRSLRLSFLYLPTGQEGRCFKDKFEHNIVPTADLQPCILYLIRSIYAGPGSVNREVSPRQKMKSFSARALGSKVTGLSATLRGKSKDDVAAAKSLQSGDSFSRWELFLLAHDLITVLGILRVIVAWMRCCKPFSQ